MRDLGSCIGEYAVQVSDASCPSYAIVNNSCINPNLMIPSIQNAVICLYRTILSTQRHLDIRVTWFKNASSTTHQGQGQGQGQGLTINFGNQSSSSSSSSPAFKLNTNSGIFRKKKGSKSLEHEDSKVEVFWDLSAAKYQTGPEPVDGYYLLIKVDSELVLILGDMAGEASPLKKLMKNGSCHHNRVAKFSLVSRQEHFSGNTMYSTKAQFCDTGTAHDILIRCGCDEKSSSDMNEKGGGGGGLRHPVLSVCVDKKTVIRVKRLQWNFRGNQTIFLDGLLIDLMWDVHDWFFNPGSSGYAVFMFRTRNGTDSSRLWLEEKVVQQKDHQEKVEFSLLIYACRCP